MERAYKILTVALIIYALLGIGRLIWLKYKPQAPSAYAPTPTLSLA